MYKEIDSIARLLINRRVYLLFAVSAYILNIVSHTVHGRVNNISRNIRCATYLVLPRPRVTYRAVRVSHSMSYRPLLSVVAHTANSRSHCAHDAARQYQRDGVWRQRTDCCTSNRSIARTSNCISRVFSALPCECVFFQTCPDIISRLKRKSDTAKWWNTLSILAHVNVFT